VLPVAEQYADLVLEGGGVKGIALVGAYSVLEERGYRVRRVAGTSAGSIVGALIAAGMTSAEMREEMRTIDYSRFQDEGLLDRLPLVGKPLSLLRELGVYQGDYAHAWVRRLLQDKGVRTFDDLPYEDTDHLPDVAGQRYRLVVMTSDVSQGCLRRLPWDYERYGYQPGEQAVADAVRASMSIPFFFKPVRLPNRVTGRESTLVDGGLLSNFPVDVFDARGREPRWPTIGIKLSARGTATAQVNSDVHGPVSLARAMLKTMSGFYDRLHVDQASVQARTVFVDTSGVRSIDFSLGREQSDWLYEQGRRAAERFLDGAEDCPAWDWEAYKTRYRSPERAVPDAGPATPAPPGGLSSAHLTPVTASAE
jgi:NTE family protein